MHYVQKHIAQRFILRLHIVMFFYIQDPARDSEFIKKTAAKRRPFRRFAA
jgi:hypothetical protein